MNKSVKNKTHNVYFRENNIVNTERFIAKRLIDNKEHLKGFGRPVLFVSVISTALGIAVMLISVFISNGFKHQIRTKVIGFGSHIQILPFLENAEAGSEPVLIDQPFYKKHTEFKAIKSIYPIAYKPGILQRGKRDEKGNLEVEGVLFKGIDRKFDSDFLKEHLIDGRLIKFGEEPSRDIIVSAPIAKRLGVKKGDTLSSVLISKTIGYAVKPDYRRFIISGIYRTGLEEFDKEYVFIDLTHIQRANGWGIHAVPDVSDSLFDKKIKITLNAITSANKLNWKIDGKNYPYYFVFFDSNPSFHTLIAQDADGDIMSDTVFISISQFEPKEIAGYSKKMDEKVYVSIIGEKGNADKYAGGFEINLNKWDDLNQTDTWLYKLTGPGFTTKTIVEQQPQIFNWLNLVEINVEVIIWLMLAVAIVNLISAILVLILERSKLIGLLKSFGASSIMAGKIFFYFTFSILKRGMIYGNLLAMGLYFLQRFTGIFTLNPETYFVSEVPVEFDWYGFLFVNVLTIVSCLMAFFIPVILVTKISPVKAIKID